MGSLTYQAIRDLQPIARNIGDTIANNAINSAKNRRADAALRYTLGRQRAEDEQRNELFRRNTEKYQRENAWRGQHFNIANLPNSPHALGHLAAKTTTGEMLADGIARKIGGKLVKDPNSQDNGKVIMPDGSIATNQDVVNNWPKVRAYMFQHTNAEKLAHDEMAKAAYAMQHARTPEEKAQFNRSYNAYQNFLNDPRKRIMQLDHKINILTQLAGQIRGEGIENDIKRLQEKKKAIRDDLNKAQDRALQRELADKRIRAERAKGRGAKDLRGEFGKLVDDQFRIGKFIDPKYTMADAKRDAIAYKNDPRVASSLREMLIAIENSFDMTPEAQKELKKNIYSGLKEIATRHAGPNKKEDPLGIR